MDCRFGYKVVATAGLRFDSTDEYYGDIETNEKTTHNDSISDRHAVRNCFFANPRTELFPSGQVPRPWSKLPFVAACERKRPD